MLGQINPNQPLPLNQSCAVDKSCSEDRWSRNEQEDFKEAIDLLYDFKKKLNKLHPRVGDLVETMLQRPRF